MKYKIINNDKEIIKYQRFFKKELLSATEYKIHGSISLPAGTVTSTLYYLRNPNIWVAFGEAHNRFWTAFGINPPSKTSNNNIRAEINIPYDGEHGSAARFARDSRNNVYLLHTGRIRRITPKKCRKLLNKKFNFNLVNSTDPNDYFSEYLLISRLDDKNFIKNIGRFVWAIHTIKGSNKIYPPDFEINKEIRQFQKEFSGKKKFATKSIIYANCNHGKVVNALYSILAKKTKLIEKDITNNKNVDLFIFDKNDKKIAFFEVKTKVNTTNLYQAVGQLLVNSAFEKNKPKLYAVLPTNHFCKQFKKLGIKTITYTLKKSKLRFQGIPNI